VSESEHLGTLTRDLLANERTYLAWLRTAVSLMVVGLAVARLLDPGHIGPLVAGILLTAVGAVGVAYATRRSRVAAALIERGDIAGRDSGRAMTVVSTVLVLTVAAALVLLLLL
jgi:putative membrane protein